MIAKFLSVIPFSFEKQKGVNLQVEYEGELTTFNVWADSTDEDNPTIRVRINNEADNLLITTVEHDDIKEPVVTFSDDRSYSYVTFNKTSLHIKLGDEGVVLDVWDANSDINGSIDSNYVLYQEFEEYQNH